MRATTYASILLQQPVKYWREVRAQCETPVISWKPDSLRRFTLVRPCRQCNLCHQTKMLQLRAQFLEEARKWKKCSMITLTYARQSDFQPGQLETYMQRLKQRLKAHGIPNAYCWVMEMQERDVPHYHIAILSNEEIPRWVIERKGKRINPVRNMAKAWIYGFTNIERVSTASRYRSIDFFHEHRTRHHHTAKELKQVKAGKLKTPDGTTRAIHTRQPLVIKPWKRALMKHTGTTPDQECRKLGITKAHWRNQYTERMPEHGGKPFVYYVTKYFTGSKNHYNDDKKLTAQQNLMKFAARYRKVTDKGKTKNGIRTFGTSKHFGKMDDHQAWIDKYTDLLQRRARNNPDLKQMEISGKPVFKSYTHHAYSKVALSPAFAHRPWAVYERIPTEPYNWNCFPFGDLTPDQANTAHTAKSRYYEAQRNCETYIDPYLSEERNVMATATETVNEILEEWKQNLRHTVPPKPTRIHIVRTRGWNMYLNREQQLLDTLYNAHAPE